MPSRRSLLALTAVAALVGPGCFNPSSGPGGPSVDASTDVGVIFDAATVDGGDGSTPALRWHIDPIISTFMQATFSTQYSVVITGNTQGGTALALPKTLTVSWRLQLQLVDPSGAPDPATPGSGAAVDVGCTNAGVGTPNPLVDSLAPSGSTSTRINDVFSWFHPDAVDSTPLGKYACNHADQGPSGHQGLVTAVVSDGVWQCTASFKGTHSSTPTSVTDGTASQPVCKAL